MLVAYCAHPSGTYISLPNSGDLKMPELITIEEVREILGCSREWVRRAVRDGRFPKPIKIGRMVRFYAQDIENFVKRDGTHVL